MTRAELIREAQLLYTKLQKLDSFGDHEANLSYALLLYIRRKWRRKDMGKK